MATILFFGRHGRCRFNLLLVDQQHAYVIGATGTGKSTLLETLIAQHLHFGAGLVLIDPHGDLAARITRSEYRSHVTTFDMADAQGLGFNPLRPVSPKWRGLVASGVLEVFKKAWPDAWGARMEHILRNAILALLDQPSADLEDILRLLRDKEFRKSVAANVSHKPIRRFWQQEFHVSRDAIAPIENKVGAFLSDPLVYRVVCQPKRQISFRKIMDQGEALLINLAKGRIGEDSASILGGLFVTMIGLAAFSRADTPENMRRPFTLYIDEFQNYTTLMVADMLSELRKYGVSMVMAHQFLDQLDPKVRNAVLGNVGTIIAFRTGPKDAATLAPEFRARYDATDLILLRDHEVMVKHMIDGCPQYPVKGWTFTPTQAFAQHRKRFLADATERKRTARRLEEAACKKPSIFRRQHDGQHPPRAFWQDWIG